MADCCWMEAYIASPPGHAVGLIPGWRGCTVIRWWNAVFGCALKTTNLFHQWGVKDFTAWEVDRGGDKWGEFLGCAAQWSGLAESYLRHYRLYTHAPTPARSGLWKPALLCVITLWRRKWEESKIQTASCVFQTSCWNSLFLDWSFFPTPQVKVCSPFVWQQWSCTRKFDTVNVRCHLAFFAPVSLLLELAKFLDVLSLRSLELVAVKMFTVWMNW